MGTDIYLDGADLAQMQKFRKNPLIRGWTTNPSLMRQSGVTDYEAFAKEAIELSEGLPISFEVFSDEWEEMEYQARKIAAWGESVFVKIPVTNTKGESAAPLIRKLSDDGIACNVTAVFTEEQVMTVSQAMNNGIISIFAGRIADAGEDYESIIANAVAYVPSPIKILWASTREVFNIYLAEKHYCHIITVSPDLLAKYEKYKGKDLTEFSLDTVKMFYNDAKKAGYSL